MWAKLWFLPSALRDGDGQADYSNGLSDKHCATGTQNFSGTMEGVWAQLFLLTRCNMCSLTVGQLWLPVQRRDHRAIPIPFYIDSYITFITRASETQILKDFEVPSPHSDIGTSIL